MSTILQIIKELLHWRRVEAEISARRLVLTELENVDKEIDGLESDIEKYRKRGDHSHADRLLLSQIRRASFARGLLTLAKGSGLSSTTRGDFGGFGGSETKGSDDNRPSEGTKET
jgi:hypothetical protein